MQIDLEDLAAGYEHRPTSAAAKARAERAADAVDLGAGDLAVDNGGGRGSHAAVWARTGARAVVADPSQRMVEVAGRRPGVIAVRAESQRLPIQDDLVQLAYFHLSIHYGDWKAAIDEAYRVLAPGGECWIFTMGEEHHRSSFLARWFPSVGDIDSARFPDPVELVAHIGGSWAAVEHGREVEHKTAAAGIWRAATQARFVSTLQLIPEEEFQAGLADFDNTYTDPNQLVEYVLTFDWIRGTK